ncbi:MAG TPA: cobalamin biosynthesis protein [Nitrososphaeraceae archaeon]|nr:cobalamin biosynthesis protein [Nitrososphaeraceae archaeon]
MKEKVAVLAITKNGIKIAEIIKKNIPTANIYVPIKFHYDDSNIIWFEESTQKKIIDLFKTNDAIICIFSLGAVIRLISHLIVDKRTDPAILVIDDKANFVISTLSGHLGGANALARYISTFLKSTPVITTAADVNKTISVDLIGNELGWIINNYENVTQVSAHMVNNEKIALFQDTGEQSWWDMTKLPSNVFKVKDVESIKDDSFRSGLIITDKIITDSTILHKSVVYRPKSLVVGIGLHWDTTKEEILKGIQNIFEKNGLGFDSIKCLSSIKKNIRIKGLDQFSKDYNIPLFLFDKEQLEKITVPNPSDIVKKFEGIVSVSEASSLFCSKGTLLIPKQKFPPNLTIAVSRVKFS